MTFENWMDFIQALGSIIASAGVIFTIRFAVRQMRDNNKIFQSQIFSNLYARLDNINTLAFEHPEVSTKLLKPYEHDKDKSEPFNSYIDLVKTFFYEMHYHYYNGLLSEEEWKSWDKTIKKFFTYPYVIGYWQKNKPEYGYKFDNYIDSIVSGKNR